MDFVKIHHREGRKKGDPPEIYPIFIIRSSKDLMIRGRDFYAVWDEENGMWSTNEDRLNELIDSELAKYRDEHPELEGARVLWMWNSDTGSSDRWHKYCQKQVRDNFRALDEKLIFQNDGIHREDYASKRLKYSLEPGNYEAWDELVGTLYSEEERHKIEWAIGSVVTGDSKELQKFLVFYGSAGTGKSTILNVIQMLFDGYYTVFDAKALGSSNDQFALEPFKCNPLVAIQHDGDLSRIEDNTRLNSVVSHEEMVMNEKFHPTYKSTVKAMLFMGTNRPVKITDSKSGIIRRLIDVRPADKKIPIEQYRKLMKSIEFELGAIAWHCREVYRADPYYYETYIPTSMIGATNDFYNFMEELALEFQKKNGTSLNYAWTQYNAYCSEAKVTYPYMKRVFKEELKTYFRHFEERAYIEGERVRNYYIGFKSERFGLEPTQDTVEASDIFDLSAESGSAGWLELNDWRSDMDEVLAACPAQYAKEDGSPSVKWDNCKTVLSDIDTRKLHYVRVPEDHIVIDFDLKDPETGEKSFELNLEAANKWPKTYAELSKSGQGIHLHYIYSGDVSKLSRIYDENIEVKVFAGKSSLRRKLSKCNDIPIATLSSGLPLREEAKVVNFDGLKNEKALRTSIKKNLNKEVHADTRSSVDFIFKILEDAYQSGMHYDVTDMRPAILAFAAKSSHQASYCIKLVSNMHFCSENASEPEEADYNEIVFFDVEVFKNLFVVVWMKDGGSPVKMINPSSEEIAELCKYKLVGFNCRRYDNHILYARLMDYDNEGLYMISQRIINDENGRNNAFFKEAYNLSYTDVYDFAAKKQSLKKWEIELGIHHQELGLPWDEPVDESLWEKVADYCVNDVVATAAVFHALHADFVAREILADISGLSVNATTNQHTTKIIFGDDPDPQVQFVYTDLSKMFPGYEYDERGIDRNRYTGKIVSGKSIYRGEDPGEGGRVYSEPGIYEDVALLDVASMHPSSIENLNLFGDIYTRRFSDLKKIRILIKHEQYDEAAKLFDGKLAKYLTDKEQAKALSNALKIAINSVYGLTSAKFDNKFRDIRNIDNIVAKRGALFMIDLQKAVEEKGFTVAHVKTDSIKIPNATQEIIDFVMEFGQKYGYTFEHEATYEKMCLVNEAVYIAKYKGGKHDGEWTATGTQFQIPYVFKTLFSHEPIEFRDICETKTVTSALYLDMNENLPDVSDYEKELSKIENKDGVKFGAEDRAEELHKLISEGHDYQFVGRAGSFCPMVPGAGGGLLLREKDGKFSSATGCKGYRWMEAEMVKTLGKQNQINRKYYAAMIDEAIATISEYGDFEVFAS